MERLYDFSCHPIHPQIDRDPDGGYLTGVGFLEAGCRGAAPDGVSGVSPDFLPPSAPEGGVPKKPTFVKRGWWSGAGRARFAMHDATSTHTSLVAHARKSWSPAVAPCLAWTSQFPTHGRPQGPQPRPTPLPPLRETRPLAVFSFGFSLGCCVLRPINRRCAR